MGQVDKLNLGYFPFHYWDVLGPKSLTMYELRSSEQAALGRSKMYGVIQQGCVSKHQSGDITKNPQDDA